ncbi:MAG: extracellular solute-binding protein, partial [Candidatus Colwellbacteria bacterium]|nr:extracellular solute-binding protein [Candidatus Colwellbacteria bacterium]
MNLSKPQFIILGIAGFVIIFFALVFLGVIPGLKSNLEIRVAKLTFWGVGDERGVWDTAISNYQNAYPGVQVEYTKVDSRNYEKLLLDALAAGQGPDIFMFHNSWLPKHANKIVPASPEQIQLSTFRSLFPQVAEQDFVRGDKIYGLPLSIDTLALFYNRDIFDNKRVAIVPSTWDEFKSTIPRVREISASNKLLKPAAAIGGTLKSIPEATDILNLIMLQKGTRMVSVDGSSADFHSPQGIEALNFYSQFSSPKNAYYAWNDSSTSSIDSFAGKQVAMVFAYASV